MNDKQEPMTMEQQKTRLPRWLRATSAAVLVTFSTMILSPSAMAVANSGALQNDTHQQQAAALSESLHGFYQQIKLNRQAVINNRAQGAGLFGTEKLVADTSAVLLEERVVQESQAVLEELAAMHQELLDRGMPQVVVERSNAVQAEFRTRLSGLRGKLQSLQNADSESLAETRLNELEAWLEAHPSAPRAQPFDPDNLPNRQMQPDPANVPRENQQDFLQAGLYDRPALQLAALGDFTYANLPQADDPAYLAESDEIVLTPAIREQAQQLQYDPVKIYHWVRNNIDWLPSWGAIQSADLTLTARRGNAMDIAGLTVALLRASQIPARYVHGTIEVEEEKYRNWTGGFDSVTAAGNYASSGGIPTTSIISGGTIRSVRMEHVWVEAAIDFHPSRGAKNLDADAWVQFDPSFKQYEFLPPLDVEAVTDLDPQQLSSDFAASGTYNLTESWGTGFDQQILLDKINSLQTQIETHITDNILNPDQEDVIGARKIIIKQYPTLPSSLPNRVIVAGARYDKLPSQLQQRVSIGLDRDLFGNPLNAISLPFARVNNEKLTLSFRPETPEDEQLLLALLPEDTGIEQFPDSIPSYLVRVVPELKLNDSIIRSGSPMSLGAELNFVTQVTLAGNRVQPARASNIIAGSYLAVSATSGSVSPWKQLDLQRRLDATRAIIQTGTEAEVAAIKREQLLGDMFYAGVLAYYGQGMAYANFLGLQDRAQQNILAGMGTVGYVPSATYLFGIPRTIEKGGISYDIPILQAAAVADGDAEKLKQFNYRTGMLMSALEHITPEAMFPVQDPDQPPANAISSIKALQIANASGQRIYQINSANMADALPNIQLDAFSMNEIRSSLSRGLEVTTHTHPVSVPGWTGAGYIILDPQTGTGTYRISGGQNGGYLDTLIAALLGLIDGGWGHLSKSAIGKAIFSDYLIKVQKVLKYSLILGVLVLGKSVAEVFLDEGFTLESFLVSAVLIAAFVATFYIVGAIAAATGILLGAILGLLVAALLSEISSYLISLIRS